MNKKRYYALVVLLVCLSTAIGQIKVSVNVIPQFNEAFGVRAGADMEFSSQSRWSFLPGIYWSMRNRNSSSSSLSMDNNGVDHYKTYDYSDRAHFLTVPLRMSVLVAGNRDSDFNMKIFFGPYIAYGLDGTSTCDSDIDGVKAQDRVGAFSARGRYKDRWDFGNNLGVDFLLKQHFKLGLMGEFGLRKIYRQENLIGDIIGEIFLVNKINLAFGISLGYQF